LHANPLFTFVAAQWARAPKTVRIPGMDHDVETIHILAFVVVLGLAIGGGYGGAQALFGKDAPKQIQIADDIQRYVPAHDMILPEPNGNAPHTARAYEEKVAEPVYATPEAHLDTPPVEVASLPPATAPTGPQPLWMQNALDVPLPHDGPIIAIVIDDMGVDRKRSRHMWEDVPGPLTLSFMTYADDLPSQTQAAKQSGHELMLHMSMEPSSVTIDPGPNVLMTAMADGEIKSLTNWGLNRFSGFVGVNNHMGSRFTEDAHAMRVVLNEVNARGLLFLDSRTSSKSAGRSVARDLGMPVLERNVFLDNENDVEKVRQQLAEVERLARKQGSAIAIGHPRDATITALKTWIPDAIARGINIVPVSMLLKSRIQAKQQAKHG
ncbi:MAG TPA: divergent polysaccharide deacetylase family protein, partial [Magnetovibrio sp.]